MWKKGIVMTVGVVVLVFALIKVVGAGVLDGKDVRAVWKFATKNGGQPIGESVSPGDTIDDSSPNGTSLEVMSPERMKVIDWECGKALVFDGETTWLREKSLVSRSGQWISFSGNPPGLIDDGEDFSLYWAKNGKASHIIEQEQGYAWGYIGKPKSSEQKDFIPVYKDRELTQPGWLGEEPVPGKSYDIRTVTLQLTDVFTLVAWFFPEKHDKGMEIVGKNDWGNHQRSFDLSITPSLDMTLQLYGQFGVGDRPKTMEEEIEKKTYLFFGGGQITTDVWRCVAVTFSDRIIRFYQNGQMTNKTSVPFSVIRDEPVPVTVGSNLCRRNGKDAASFKGYIGRITVLGESLNETEIKSFYEEEGKELIGERLKEKKDWDKKTEDLLKQLQ